MGFGVGVSIAGRHASTPVSWRLLGRPRPGAGRGKGEGAERGAEGSRGERGDRRAGNQGRGNREEAAGWTPEATDRRPIRSPPQPRGARGGGAPSTRRRQVQAAGFLGLPGPGVLDDGVHADGGNGQWDNGQKETNNGKGPDRLDGKRGGIPPPLAPGADPAPLAPRSGCALLHENWARAVLFSPPGMRSDRVLDSADTETS